MQPASRNRPALFRSTPLRLALTFAFLLVVAFVLTGFAIYQQMRSDLIHNLDETLRSTYAVLTDSYQDNDLEDLIATVDSHSKLAASNGQLFSLTASDGTLLAGDALPPSVEEGVHSLRAGARGQAAADYRALTGDIGANRLTVAFSTRPVQTLLNVVLTGFAWASFAVVALAIGGGVLLASRAQHRLDAIAATMNAVSSGRLDARIPLMGNGDDIDELSARVNAALNRLNDLVDGVRQVSNDIAHELKTPLNRLQLIIERALDQPKGSSRILEDALSEIGQLNNTFEALLRIAGIESGAARSRFTEVDLAKLLCDLSEIYADVADDTGHKLTHAGPGSGIIIDGDRDLLTQLFANLIENALRHTAPGTQATVSINAEGADVVASVADSGSGIPLEERDKVLRRLYRLDKSRSTPGSGLGLSIVAAIAKLHNASLELEDNAPGLRVVVRFPRRLSLQNLSKS